IGANPVNLGQLRTGDLIQHGADVKIHGDGSSVTTTEFRSGRVGIRALRRKQGQGLFYLRIAFLDTGLIDVIQTQCLLQAKDMFRLIVANESRLDGLFAGFTAAIAQLGSHNLHARLARYVSYDVVQLQIHVVKRLVCQGSKHPSWMLASLAHQALNYSARPTPEKMVGWKKLILKPTTRLLII